MNVYRRYIIVALGLALAGCGGGDGSGDTSTSASVAGSAAATATQSDLPVDGSVFAYDATGDSSSPTLQADSLTSSGTHSAEAVDPGTARALSVRALAGSTTATSSATSSFDDAYALLAPGWSINWWGSAKPTFSGSRETRSGYVADGTASQRFRLDSIASGGGAHLIYPFPFVKGTTYSASIKVRSDVGQEVEFQLRRNSWPYQVTARKVVTVGSTWQTVSLSGLYDYPEAGSFRVIAKSLGKDIYLDQFQVSATAAPVSTAIALPVAGAAGEGTHVVKSSNMDSAFTRFAEGWYFNSFGGTAQADFVASRETNSAYVYRGASSQKFQVVDKKGGELHLINSFPFVQGKTYRTTVYLRADAPTPVQVFMRMDAHPWTPFGSKKVTVGTSWQKVEVEGTYTGTAVGSLRISVMQPTGTIWVDEMSIAEVVHNDMAPVFTTTVPDTLFGMHVNKLGTHNNWPGIGTSILRLWNTATTWKDVEKSNGSWDFVQLDKYVDYARSHDAQILYVLGQTPTWASSTPSVSGLFGAGASGAPKNMDDWRDYVRTLARRYAGRIRNWELWNEPDYVGNFTGTTAQLVEMARIAKEELKAADASNVLVGPGFTAGQGIPALDNFLAAGGGAYVDIVGFHWYYASDPEALGAAMDNVRGVMKAYGVGDKPIWNTEGAFVCNPAVVANCSTAVPAAEESRGVNARAMFMMADKGVTNFNFHIWEATDNYRKLVEADFVTPTVAAKAFAEARTWLKGARITDAYRTDDKVYVVRLTRGADNFVVLWSTQANTVVTLPAEWTMTRTRSLTGTEAAIPATRQLSLNVEPVLLKP